MDCHHPHEQKAFQGTPLTLKKKKYEFLETKSEKNHWG